MRTSAYVCSSQKVPFSFFFFLTTEEESLWDVQPPHPFMNVFKTQSSPHWNQTHNSIRHWFCHRLVTFGARPCERLLSVPVTEPSVGGDVEADAWAEMHRLSRKHCQIKSPRPASKQSGVLLILCKRQLCGSHKAAVFHTSSRMVWLFLDVCVVINQGFFTGRRALGCSRGNWGKRQ